jgi:hypothetical protein
MISRPFIANLYLGRTTESDKRRNRNRNSSVRHSLVFVHTIAADANCAEQGCRST